MIRTEWAAEADLFAPAAYIPTRRDVLINASRCALDDLEAAEQGMARAKAALGKANKAKVGGLFPRKMMQAQAMRALNVARARLRRASAKALDALDALKAA